MAEQIKKVLTIEIDVESGEVNRLDTQLKKAKKTIKETKDESGGFGEKLLKVGDAIKGLGIGLAIAGLAKLGDAFRKNQKIADATESTMNSLDVAFSRFTNTIAESETIQSTGWRDWLSTLANLDPTNSLRLVDHLVNGTKAGREYTDELEKIGKQITENNKQLALLEVEQRKLQLLNQNEAEIQRQIRDDSTLTFEQRFDANDKLAIQLDESIKKEKEVVNTRIANLEFLQNNLTYSFEREVEIKNLRVELLDIEERITGVKSEQQAAERSLINERKAADEQAKRDAADRLKASEEEFDALMDSLESQMETEGNLRYNKRRELQHREEDAKAKQLEAELDAENEYYKELEDLSDANFERTLSFQDLEIRAVQDQYFNLIELAEKYGQDKAALEEQQQAAIQEIKDRYAKEDAKKQLKDAQELNQAKMGLAIDAFGALIALNDAFAWATEEQQRKAFQRDKALKIGQAIMSTGLAVTAALTAGGNPIKLATGMQFIEAGIAGAMGLAQVAAIAKTHFNPSGGSSGGGVPSVSAPTATAQAPQFNTVGTSGFNQLSDSIAGQNQRPVQAYVVANDVSSAQSLDRNRVKQASFP